MKKVVALMIMAVILQACSKGEKSESQEATRQYFDAQKKAAQGVVKKGAVIISQKETEHGIYQVIAAPYELFDGYTESMMCVVFIQPGVSSSISCPQIRDDMLLEQEPATEGNGGYLSY